MINKLIELILNRSGIIKDSKPTEFKPGTKIEVTEDEIEKDVIQKLNNGLSQLTEISEKFNPKSITIYKDGTFKIVYSSEIIIDGDKLLTYVHMGSIFNEDQYDRTSILIRSSSIRMNCIRLKDNLNELIKFICPRDYSIIQTETIATNEEGS